MTEDSLQAHPRPHHLAWHGLTLKADHPFWRTHFAPNGWGCRCRIEAVSKREGEASAAAGLDDLPADWNAIDPKTGTVVGIDKGFDYAPGAGVKASMRSLVEAKLIKLPPELADALRSDMERMNKPPAAPMQQVAPTPLPEASPANVQATAFVNAATDSPRNKQPSLVLSPMSETAINRASAIGINLSGKSIALDHDGVRHIIKSHGGKDEIKRGQIPITTSDIANWEQIFNAAQLKLGDPPYAKDKTQLISGSAVVGEWLYGFAAKVRRSDVVPLTLFKRQYK